MTSNKSIINIILFDTGNSSCLFPLTLNKAVADVRCGVLTQKERWEKLTAGKVFVFTEKYLQPIYEPILAGEYLLVDASVLPSKHLIQQILALNMNERLDDENGLIATRINVEGVAEIDTYIYQPQGPRQIFDTVKRLNSPTQIFAWNDEAIRFDFALLTQNKVSQQLNNSVQTTNPENIFIEQGAQLSHCIINAQAGPVYIGKNATVMEGCTIRGPFAMGESAVLKMGAKIYGATTIGNFSTAGGEIKNSVISSYSNKAHDGYLGDSVIGEWCNLGAGTSNSNLKNTGEQIGLYDYASGKYFAAGNKCGVIMGDYSRTAINTSINTGTVIGICSHVFGIGLTPKFIPDFSWGFNDWKAYSLDNAIRDINNWKEMKKSFLSEAGLLVLRHLYENLVTNRAV